MNIFTTVDIHSSTRRQIFEECLCWHKSSDKSSKKVKCFLTSVSMVTTTYVFIVAYLLWWNKFSYVRSLSGLFNFMKALTRKYGCWPRCAPHSWQCLSKTSVVRPVWQSDLWLLIRSRIKNVFPVFVTSPSQNAHSR